MRHNMNTLKPAEICAQRAANGIMEVEQEFVTSDMALTKSAKPVLADALQGQDGKNEHLHDAGEHSTAPSIWVGKEVSAMTDKPNSPAKRVVEIDTAKYQSYLNDPSLDEATKQEIVEAIWSIIVNFVDLGFEVHPLQEAQGPEPCGKLTQGLDAKAGKDSNESKPVHALTNEFERASDDT